MYVRVCLKVIFFFVNFILFALMYGELGIAKYRKLFVWVGEGHERQVDVYDFPLHKVYMMPTCIVTEFLVLFTLIIYLKKKMKAVFSFGWNVILLDLNLSLLIKKYEWSIFFSKQKNNNIIFFKKRKFSICMQSVGCFLCKILVVFVWI